MEGIGVLGDDNSTACECKAVSHACVRYCEQCTVTIECNSYLCLQ